MEEISILDKHEIIDNIIRDGVCEVPELPKKEERELTPAFRLSGKGEYKRPAKTPYNVIKALEIHTSIKDGVKYNEFSKTIEKTHSLPWVSDIGVWNDEDTQLAIALIDNDFGFTPSKDIVQVGVLKIAKGNIYNPVKDRIEQMRWDGVQRAEKYFIHLLGCEDSAYTREVTKLWLTGLVSRVYEAGIKFEIVPILTGGQGIGKSTATKRLLPEYHSDSVKDFGKSTEDYRILQANVVIEFGELKGMKSAEIESIKNFISASHDDVRELYAKKTTKTPRHSVFIGTSNKTGFLKDNGKERRFFPLKCGVIKQEIHPMEEEEIYFLQVLAEAKYWYDNHEPITVSEELDKQLEEIQSTFKEEDPATEAILGFIENFYPPEEWYELSRYERKQYYLKSSHEPLEDNRDYSDYPLPFGSELLNETTPAEIAYIVFGENPTKGRAGGFYSQKAREVLDNLPNWERGVGQKRIWRKGTPVPFYKRR